jgi:hypothetical protein
MAPRSEKITTPHQQNQVLAQTKPNLLFKSGESKRIGRRGGQQQ